MEDDDLYDGYNDFNSAFNTDVTKIKMTWLYIKKYIIFAYHFIVRT